MEQPSMDEFFELCNKLFSANDLKWKAAEYKPRNTIDSSYLIMNVEVHKQLAKFRESAIGVDEINHKDFRRAPWYDLFALLNIQYGIKSILLILGRNRTALLPKTGDLS